MKRKLALLLGLIFFPGDAFAVEVEPVLNIFRDLKGDAISCAESADDALYPNGLGASLGDYDNDADLDIFMIARSGFSGSVQYHLFKNNHGGTFNDVASSAGLKFAGEALGAGWGDVDHDGFPDLFLFPADQPAALYHNQRDGTFTD